MANSQASATQCSTWQDSRPERGGCGYHSTERRAVFLNTLNNVPPQMIGDSISTKPGLWPSLAAILGTDSFKEGNEATRWETFFASGSVWAQELESEIERVKTLRVDALEADGRSNNPPAHEIFDVPTVGFGLGSQSCNADYSTTFAHTKPPH